MTTRTARQNGQTTPQLTKQVRCAVYTRKSTDEGLDQEFNSLDAQREAAEAYIASQKHEGWTCLPDRYDDGGFSGGTIDRPALRRLLTDVEAGRDDACIVYKVECLSRSLLDFARILGILEKQRVAFVSITQAFSSATSAGRLMLNENEAQTVRRIFEVYLQRQSLLNTVHELNRQGITTKRWTTRKGVERGGGPWDKAKLAYTLGNWTFAGKVDRIRGIGTDPTLLTEVLKKTRADLQDRVDGLDRERREVEKDLRRCAAEVKRLVGASQTTATTARLADLQDRITAGEQRIAEIRREVGALKPRTAQAALVERFLERIATNSDRSRFAVPAICLKRDGIPGHAPRNRVADMNLLNTRLSSLRYAKRCESAWRGTTRSSSDSRNTPNIN